MADIEDNESISYARAVLADTRATKKDLLSGVLAGIIGLYDELAAPLWDQESPEEIQDAMDVMPSSIDLSSDEHQQTWTKLGDVAGQDDPGDITTGRHAAVQAFLVPENEEVRTSKVELDSGDPTAKETSQKPSFTIWNVRHLEPELGFWDTHKSFSDDREAFNYIDGLPPEQWRVEPQEVDN